MARGRLKTNTRGVQCGTAREREREPEIVKERAARSTAFGRGRIDKKEREGGREERDRNEERNLAISLDLRSAPYCGAEK